MGAFQSPGSKPSVIEPGERFQSVDKMRIVWVVLRRVMVSDPQPHHLLYQESDPGKRKTLSESVLLDRKFYRRLGPAVPPQ